MLELILKALALKLMLTNPRRQAMSQRRQAAHPQHHLANRLRRLLLTLKARGQALLAH